jgi:hypothetical protein
VDTTERAELVEIMGRLREGDEAAVFMLMDRFGPPIRRALAAMARERGYRPNADDLTELTVDACLLLAQIARGWRPDGALPWTWARKRLVNLVDEWAGPRCVPLDDADLESAVGGEPWTGHEPEPLDTLELLAACDDRCGLLLGALRESVPASDRDVYLRYAVQLESGDPAPSTTVGAELGLRPPAVRKRASRARQRLQQRVASDSRFADLEGIRLLTPSSLHRDHPPDSLTSAASAAYSGGRTLEATAEAPPSEERAA